MIENNIMNLRAIEHHKSSNTKDKNTTIDNIIKLSPKEGDILIFRGIDDEYFNDIIEAINSNPDSFKRFMYVRLEDNESIEILDEKDMNDAGWYRRE